MADEQPDNEFDDVVTRLRAERPVPGAGFRGELRRSLFRTDPAAARPRRLRGLIAAYSTSGLALFAVAILGVAGVGPLAS